MIGKVIMEISKEEMMRIIEVHLNRSFISDKVLMVQQVRQKGDRFVITFEGDVPKNAERPKAVAVSPSRPTTEAVEGDESLAQGAA